MASTRQTDFSAGEISPLLHSRTDAPWFAKACRSLLNFIVTKQGAAASRPGTTYVGEAKTSVEYTAETGLFTSDSETFVPVLIPFNAADDESFVLEFGLQYIRIIHNGGYVETAPGSGVKYQVTTPYLTEDLRKLHYAQVGEVLTLVCPNWDPAELRHVSDSPPVWTFETAVTAPPQPWYRDIDAPAGFEVTTPYLLCDGSGTAPDATPLPTADADHPGVEWQWYVTALCRDNATGELYETLPELVSEQFSTPFNDDPLAEGADYDSTHAPLTTDTWALYSDQAITLRRAHSGNVIITSSDAFDTATIVSYQFYRGRGGLYGYVGSTTSREFVDVGVAPNNEIQPPVGTDPFGTNREITDAVAPYDLVHEDRPSAVAYFEGRRAFGGPTRRESDVVVSAAGDFDNFDEHKLFHMPNEAVKFTIAARRRGRIRHLVSQRRLVTLTAAASYSFGGSEGSPLEFDSIAAPLIEEVGANDVTPAVVGGSILFARAKGRGLRALATKGSNEGYAGFDASQLAEHLFRGTGKSVIDMSYAEDPWGVLWVVLEDGTLLSLTYEPDGMLAWARHLMGFTDEDGTFVTSGTVEGVCAVPEGDEDAVYLVVKRTIDGVDHHYIERMTARHERGGCVLDELDNILTPPDYVCVDSALEYVGPAATTFTGLSHLEGKEVWVVAQSHPVMGPYTVTGGSITLEGELATNVTGPVGDRLVAYIGLLYHCEMELLDVAGGEARGRNKQVTHVGFEVDNAKGVLAGQDFDNLDDQPSREVADDFGTAPLQTNFFFVGVRGTYDYSARAVLRQSEPLPVTVLGITRRLDVGDAGGS